MIQPGTLVAERFEVEKRAGSGGMGVIFRARDRHTGLPVALKVLPAESTPQDTERFMREAQLLSELRHPGIVTYVAHGRTLQGMFYLALEWLQGEDLGRRLERGPLSVEDSLTIVRVVADALATIHRHGIVHRDIKPSNLLLRDGLVERVTLVDFGIARGGLSSWSVTRTGEVMGTLHYVAPEQARGEQRVGPSADIFALGCVLFECLTGAPPFSGKNTAVVLARILYEEVPPVRRLRPELPDVLEALLGRMLAKDPSQRLVDGEMLMTALRTIDTSAEPTGAPPPRLMLETEQRLVSIIMATPRPTLAGESVTVNLTEDGGLIAAQRVALEEFLQPYGARIDHLAGGTTLVSVARASYTATDQAVQAARVALALRDHLQGSAVALTTGQGLLSDHLPTGEALERAGQLVLEGIERVAAEGAQVWIDELTAGLIDGRFDVRQVEGIGYVLERERVRSDETRRLLGRLTPFVGREQELQLLEMSLASCLEEMAARAVLVTGGPGVGKSRLRRELLRRLREREETVSVLLGHGESLRAGTTYGMLARALSDLCGLGEGMDLGLGRARFGERMGRHVVAAERQHVVEFLGELCGVLFSDEQSPQLKAAHQDPRIMSDQVTAALVTFLRAECAVHPVLLVLEDLHWGDAATVRLVDAVLRELGDQPLLVLALGRPEIKELFPRLWEERKMQEIRLAALGRKASERLAREMLGERATPETIARIATQAGGNALFLEELIRAVAEGAGEELPETVLAMLQERFLRLEPGARRLLRAASIFGEMFWRGGLVELLGAERHLENEIDRWLEILVETETIVRQAASRFPGEVEFAFRHKLLRDAAYSLLTVEDRREGHRLAGGYLERMGESDALVLGEHYRRGGQRWQAASFYARAAARALEVSDLEGARDCAERGIACGAAGEVLGTLRGAQAWASFWNGELASAHTVGSEALGLLQAGDRAWYQMLGLVLGAAGMLGQRESFMALVRTLGEVEPLPGACGTEVEPVMAVVMSMGMTGMRELAVSFLRRSEEAGARLGDNEARAHGIVHLTQGWYRRFVEHDPWQQWVAAQAACSAFAAAGDQRFHALAEGLRATSAMILGDQEGAIAGFRGALEKLDRLQEPLVMASVRGDLALALVESGEPRYVAEGRALAEEQLAQSPIAWWWGYARCTLAVGLAASGDLVQAEREARQGLEMVAAAPATRPMAISVLLRILLARGLHADARALAEEGRALLSSLGGTCWMDVRLELAIVDAYAAVGEGEEAGRLLEALRGKILTRAERIVDVRLREQYLRRVPDNVRTLESGGAAPPPR